MPEINAASTTPNSAEPSSVVQPRYLLIRFSSFGDIIQALPAVWAIRAQHPKAHVDWLVRSEFAELLQPVTEIQRILPFPRSAGFGGLLGLAWQLGRERYTVIYDAHNNLRSSIVRWTLLLHAVLLWLRHPLQRPHLPTVVTRSKNRWRRFLFFRFRLRTLPKPYIGALSFLWPLRRIGVLSLIPDNARYQPLSNAPADVLERLQQRAQASTHSIIALAPSAAWAMKRWPLEYFRRLIELMPDITFVLLGGPEDQFLDALVKSAPTRVLNLAGQLTLAQNAAVIAQTDLLIANDTGLLHLADQMQHCTLALLGPSAFGFPSRATSVTLVRDLPCQPCSKDGRGKCVNSLYQRCLVEITPEEVAAAARAQISKLAKVPPRDLPR